MAIDPIQGLIDYVNEVKPFHTKILEVAVAYSHNDDVDLTITEDLQLDVSLFWPGVVGSPDEGPIRVCSAGYGVEYDRATPYIIVDANISPETISLEGNHEDAFAVGSSIEIREPYSMDSFGSPTLANTPRVAVARVLSVSYDTDTDTTVLNIIILSEDWLGSPIYWVGSPSVRPTSTSSFFPMMTGELKTNNVSYSNMATIIIDGEEYATRNVSIGAFGSPITADYVIVPPPTDSFDNTNIFVAPFRTNSSGSPAIADTGPYQNGKYYFELEILDLEGPSNSGWGPYFGFGRAERTRADNRFSSRPNETVVLDTYVNTDIQHGSGLLDTNGGSNRAIGHVYSMAIDYENSKVWFAQNGTWLGTGTQDPATNQGGFWPGDFTTTSNFGADVHAHMLPMMWLFNQGTTATGSPFNKPSTQDKIGIRLTDQYWSYTPPSGFGEWPEIESHPNVYEPGETLWHYRDRDRAGVRVGDISASLTHMSNFGNAAIAHMTLDMFDGGNKTVYHGLERPAALGGKFYFEGTYITAAISTFGLLDASELGSPIGAGSPYIRTTGATTYINPSNGEVYNSAGLPSVFNDPTTKYRAGGLFETGNPSRDGRSGDSGSVGDTFMFAIDFDQNRVWTGVNGVWNWGLDPATVGSPQGGLTLWNSGGSPDQNALAKTYVAYANGKSPFIYNLGGAAFYYDPPTGYEAWAYKAPLNFGSPLTVPSGSPPFGGNEFWFPPYDGNDSGGDVFAIYDVVETNTLNIVTRPVEYYGSPGTVVGSPFKPIWPSFEGSPFPGSPKGFTGSPATYPNFGSPETHGNTIVIKSTTPDVFLYGQEVEIRNATNTDINRAYNIFSVTDLGGSPNLVELSVLDRILANTTNDGELLFTPDGFSGGDICGDVPPEILQTHWLEDLDFDWRFVPGESGNTVMLPAFQHFIIEADATSNTINVQGDTRYILNEFGSPIGGSPTSIPATIQHNIAGSPATLTANNTEVAISNITYDADTNTSTLYLDTVSVSTPTGWIVPVLPSPLPAGILALGASTLNPFLYYSADGVTTWNTIPTMTGGSPSIDIGYGIQYMANLEQWVVLARDTTNNATELWTTSDTDPDDSTRWTRVFRSTDGFQAGGMKYANGRLVITAWTGSVWYTDDLVTFTPTGFASGNVFFRVAYGGVGSWGTGFWCISGGNGDGAYSTDNGQTWTRWADTIGSGSSAYALECGDEVGGSGYPRIVAGAESNNSIYTSDDAGSSWTDRTLNWPAGGRWEALGRNWNTGTFIAGSSAGQWIRSTDNGTTWQSGGSPTTGIDTWPGGGAATDVLYDDANEIWVATGTQSTNPAIWTSDDDGLSWTQQTTGVGSPDSGTGAYRIGAKSQSTA